MELNKKGELMTKEIDELILGVVAVIVMTVLFYNLISPNFDKGDETAEAYFGIFNEELRIADSGGVGNFLMWQPEEDVGFYLVYFVDAMSFEEFRSVGNNKNHICVCYLEDGEGTCEYCENLKYPVLKDGRSGRWKIGFGENLEMRKEGDYYDFKSVE